MTGQCHTNPVTGIAGDIYNAWIAATDAALASGVTVQGSALRNLFAAQIESFAASINAAPAGALGDPVTVAHGGTNATTAADARTNLSAAGSATTLTAGAGLTGGGDLSSNRTFAVGAGTGITVNADDVAVSYGTTSTTACVGNDSRLSDSRAPTGSASGDLSGTYPGPTVAKINGATLGTTTATSGRLLVADGSAWQSVAMSSDATMASSGALTLANSGVTAATYGSASNVAQVTFDAKGRATSASDVAIAVAASAITSGTLTAVRGGTGNASYAVGDLLSADTTSSLSRVAAVATGYVLASQGTSTLPAYLAPGGDISGAIGAITVGKINGAALGTTTGATKYQNLQWNGSAYVPSGYTTGRALYGGGSLGPSTISVDGSLATGQNLTSFTVDITETCTVAGWRVLCSVTATINGTLSAKGGNASGSTGGTGTTTANFLGGSGGGGNGANNANGGAGTGQITSYGGTGGVGGTSGTGRTGGAAGTATQYAYGPGDMPSYLWEASTVGNIVMNGGGGGSAGGGDATHAGGGGGAGGGPLVLMCCHLVLGASAVITAAGGNGAAGTGNAGGGGAGGGGVIWLVCDDIRDGSGNFMDIPVPVAGVYTFSNGAIITVAAGTVGAASGTGAAGAAGNAGHLYLILNANSN